MTNRWEYEITETRLYFTAAELTARGQDGWELVSEQERDCGTEGTWVRTVWKRPQKSADALEWERLPLRY